MTYTGTDYEPIRPLPLPEGKLVLLLEGEHDDGQREDKCLPRASERYANHVTTSEATEEGGTKIREQAEGKWRSKSHGHGKEAHTVGSP